MSGSGFMQIYRTNKISLLIAQTQIKFSQYLQTGGPVPSHSPSLLLYYHPAQLYL